MRIVVLSLSFLLFGFLGGIVLDLEFPQFGLFDFPEDERLVELASQKCATSLTQREKEDFASIMRPESPDSIVVSDLPGTCAFRFEDFARSEVIGIGGAEKAETGFVAYLYFKFDSKLVEVDSPTEIIVSEVEKWHFRLRNW